MIQYFVVTNEAGESLQLMFHGGPERSGLRVVNVDGLGSPTTSINTLVSPNKDGTTVNKKRAEPRTISMQIAVTARTPLEEEAARLSLYQFFPSKGQIELRVVTTTRDLVITAEVEENPVSPFASIENTELQLYCPHPYFRSVETQSVVISKVIDDFEFPFSNESLTEDLITFGDILGTPYRNVVYPSVGTQPNGVLLDIHFNEGVSTDINLYSIDANETMVIDISVVEGIIGGPVLPGDDIQIDTRVGQKRITFMRGGSSWNILNSLGLDTTWLQIIKGDNQFTYDLSGADTDDITMTVNYDILYDGV